VPKTRQTELNWRTRTETQKKNISFSELINLGSTEGGAELVSRSWTFCQRTHSSSLFETFLKKKFEEKIC
jgi:hypothetical protein